MCIYIYLDTKTQRYVYIEQISFIYILRDKNCEVIKNSFSNNVILLQCFDKKKKILDKVKYRNLEIIFLMILKAMV